MNQPESDLTFNVERDVPKLQTLAENQDIFLGTSSYKYPGWWQKFYFDNYGGSKKEFVKKKFEEHCLEEYARKCRTVCYDAAYYRFPDPKQLEKLAAQLPDNFQLAFKVTDAITKRRFNQGTHSGELNGDFLDARIFSEYFLPPVVDVLGKKLGPIIFEFSPFHFGTAFAKDTYRPMQFIRQLEKFFSKIPVGDNKFAVEIRDPILLTAEYRSYFDVLENFGIAHALNEQTWMPELLDQLDVPGILTAGFTVVRALVRPGISHQQAVDQFAPYTEITNPMPDLRKAIVEVMQRARDKRIRAYIFVNNRTEGNAPDTIANVINLYERQTLVTQPIPLQD